MANEVVGLVGEKERALTHQILIVIIVPTQTVMLEAPIVCMLLQQNAHLRTQRRALQQTKKAGVLRCLFFLGGGQMLDMQSLIDAIEEEFILEHARTPRHATPCSTSV